MLFVTLCIMVALCIGEHAVGGLIRTAVAAILAGEGLVGADGFPDAHAAAGVE